MQPAYWSESWRPTVVSAACVGTWVGKGAKSGMYDVTLLMTDRWVHSMLVLVDQGPAKYASAFGQLVKLAVPAARVLPWPGLHHARSSCRCGRSCSVGETAGKVAGSPRSSCCIRKPVLQFLSGCSPWVLQTRAVCRLSWMTGKEGGRRLLAAMNPALRYREAASIVDECVLQTDSCTTWS